MPEARADGEAPTSFAPELRRGLQSLERQCEACGGWNTIAEETGSANPMVGPVATRPSRAKGRIFLLEGLAGDTKEALRTPSGIAELDRVTGGFVHGSVILLGGDPGIGKSTSSCRPPRRWPTEPAGGLHIRRGGGGAGPPQGGAPRARPGARRASSETNVEDIIATLSQGQRPALAIVDSIQTMWTETVESAPGTVTQVRGSARR